MSLPSCFYFFFFFFNDTATTEIYTLSLHDALPISRPRASRGPRPSGPGCGTARSPTPVNAAPRAAAPRRWGRETRDRKSTRLNSSHSQISYAVFCLKKKKKIKRWHTAEQHTPSQHE